jgi:ribosomal protein L11 methyltransferase
MEIWTQLRMTTARDNAETCAQLLMDCGCDGAQIDDVSVLLDESEDATLAPKPDAVVTGYLSPAHSPGAVEEQLRAALHRGGIAAQIEVSALEQQDWSTSWQQNFPPMRIGPFLIVPPWEEEAALADEAAIPLRLDPGLAFGTGQHPTTRMCLELLSERLSGAQGGAQISVDGRKRVLRMLDVGCGSGILSIAAAKLGAHVTGSDPDRFCVLATCENAQANDVRVQIVQAAGVEWARTQFELVVANLMSALLIALAPQLAAATEPGGTLIVSGISAPRADEVEVALHEAGFATIDKREMDGEQRGDFLERWAAFVMEKQPVDGR